MKKKTLKVVASTMVLTFGLSVVPMPAHAVSTNIVSETKNKNTLTISQIQDLAVIYNDNAQKLQLNMKQIDLGEQMSRNERHSLENSINSMGGSSAENPGLLILQNRVDDLTKRLEEEPDNTELQADLAYAQFELQSALATQDSMAASMQSGLDSALAGIDQINDSLDDLKNNKDDLNKAMKDLETQMRYTAASLSLSAIQLEKSIAFLEDQDCAGR